MLIPYTQHMLVQAVASSLFWSSCPSTTAQQAKTSNSPHITLSIFFLYLSSIPPHFYYPCTSVSVAEHAINSAF
jgi:hypothetical protein